MAFSIDYEQAYIALVQVLIYHEQDRKEKERQEEIKKSPWISINVFFEDTRISYFTARTKISFDTVYRKLLEYHKWSPNFILKTEQGRVILLDDTFESLGMHKRDVLILSFPDNNILL